LRISGVARAAGEGGARGEAAAVWIEQRLRRRRGGQHGGDGGGRGLVAPVLVDRERAGLGDPIAVPHPHVAPFPPMTGRKSRDHFVARAALVWSS
jgi:hypothetical protein